MGWLVGWLGIATNIAQHCLKYGYTKQEQLYLVCVSVTNMAKTKMRKAVSKPVRRKIARKVGKVGTKEPTKPTKHAKKTRPTKPKAKKLRGGEQTEHVVVDDCAWLILPKTNGVLEAWLLDFAYCDNGQAKYPYLKFEQYEQVHSTAVGFDDAGAYQNADLPTRDAFGMPS